MDEYELVRFIFFILLFLTATNDFSKVKVVDGNYTIPVISASVLTYKYI